MAQAAEWKIEPVIRIAADFDDNPYLSIRTDGDENASGTILEGAARVSYAAETTNFRLTPRIRSRSYGSTSDLDSDDQFLTADFTTRTQSLDLRLRGNYTRESIRTAERADTDFNIEDPEDIPEDDSGIVDDDDPNARNRGRRERLSFTPSLRYRLSSISALTARVAYQDVTYDDIFTNILTDYTNARLSLAYSRAFSPRNTAIVGASYRTFEAEGTPGSVDGIGFNLGFDRRLTETTRFRATAGLEDTEIINASNELAWVADLSLSRELETISLLAQYRRTVSASGAGQLGSRDSINFNFTRDLSDKVSAGLGARVYATNAVNDTAQNFDDQDYVQLRSQFTWNVTEVFSIEANYRYTILDRETRGESSNSNEITLWFSYQPRAIVRSR